MEARIFFLTNIRARIFFSKKTPPPPPPPLEVKWSLPNRKWSRILVDFPIPKFKSDTETQQWLEILADIYTYLCNTDDRIRSALVETGPRPFTLECRSPWGCGIQHPDIAAFNISDILVGVRVALASDTLTTRQSEMADLARRATRWVGTLSDGNVHVKFHDDRLRNGGDITY